MRTLAALSNQELTTALVEALERQERARINIIVAALLDRQARLGRQWRSIATVMTRNGEHPAAIEAVTRYVAAEQGSAAARLEEVMVRHAAGRVDEARALLATLPDDCPDRGTHYHLLGSLAAMAGDRDAARTALLTAVAASPVHGQAWLGLATLEHHDAGSAIGDAILEPDPVRTGRRMMFADAYHYAQGKVSADRDRHDAAFAAFTRGAAIAKAAQRFDMDREERLVDEVTRGFDAAFVERVAGSVSIETSRPIFVTGNPRSGTTLVEQILTSHSAVKDGGELDIVRIVGQEIGGPRREDLEAYLERRPVDSLSALYLDLLTKRFGPAGRIVDKRLLASRSLGLIAAILPHAPLIWMRRDPLNCAWSCFKTYLNLTAPWSYDLETIARQFRLEDRLLSIWQDRLGSRLLVVPYEALVAAPERWIALMLDHCGLAPEQGVFTPHKTQRAVTTASVMQVRRPINLDGVGAADPYRRHLQPFIDAYER